MSSLFFISFIVICGIILTSLIMRRVALSFIATANAKTRNYDATYSNPHNYSTKQKQNRNTRTSRKIFSKDIGEYVSYEEVNDNK